ncbi:hypothetical protein BLA29_013529, partial [Euroglyphus maynei]
MLRHLVNVARSKSFQNVINLCRNDNNLARYFRTTTIHNNVNEKLLLYDRLCDIVGVENVSKAEAVREQYGRDESHFSSVLADFVVWPLNTDH